MPKVPARVASRLTAALKRFQPVITRAHARDVNEADTVVIVTDVLTELFGYDKYTEITSEYAIRTRYCDLAVKVEGKLEFIVEVKAIGLELKDSHVRQAVDYAANQGVEWVILTNGVIWQIFRVSFGKPINEELILELDLLSLDPKSPSDLECLFLLTRRGLLRSVLDDYHAQREATNRFLLSALVLSEPVLKVIRRELKRLSPDVKIKLQDMKSALKEEVLKREVVEGEESKEARKKVQKAQKKLQKHKRQKAVPPPPGPLAGSAVAETEIAPEEINE